MEDEWKHLRTLRTQFGDLYRASDYYDGYCEIPRRNNLNFISGSLIHDWNDRLLHQMKLAGYSLKDLADYNKVPLFEPDSTYTLRNTAYVVLVKSVSRVIEDLAKKKKEEANT